MGRLEEASEKLKEQITELHKISHAQSSRTAIENLKRWKDRTTRTIASLVNEEEARKFSAKKVGLMNVDPDTNLADNIEYQESHLTALLQDIVNHPNDYFGDSVPLQVPGAPLDSTLKSALRLLHPKILKVSSQKLADGHYADSVETAFKAVNMRVKAFYKDKKGQEIDGADLMHQAFSPKNPTIVLDNLDTETGWNIQQGYMEIFAGSMSAIRNPKAHEIIDIDATRAIHFLFVASLEMSKLDEAKVP